MSTEKTILVLLSRGIINNFGDPKYPTAQVQIWRRTKASLTSVPYVDFFYLQKMVWGFPLAHYFNFLFKYTQIAVWVLWFLKTSFSKYRVVLPLFLLQAKLSDSEMEHLIVVETSLSKGSILNMYDAPETKLLCCLWR